MTTCEKCGKILRDQDRFCPNCGAAVPKKDSSSFSSSVLSSTPEPIFGDYTSPILETKPEPIFGDSSSFMTGYSSPKKEEKPAPAPSKKKTRPPKPPVQKKKVKAPEYNWEDWSEKSSEVSAFQRTLPETSQPAGNYYQVETSSQQAEKE